MAINKSSHDNEKQSWIECPSGSKLPARRVWICPDSDNPVPVTFASAGSPIRESFIGDTDQANPILDIETDANKIRRYTQIVFVCRRTVSFKVKNNGVQFMSVRLGPANPTVAIRIENGEDVIAGNNITVELIKAFSTPDVPLEVYIRGGEIEA